MLNERADRSARLGVETRLAEPVIGNIGKGILGLSNYTSKKRISHVSEQRRTRKADRGTHGQGLVEGTCGMLMITTLFVGLLIMGLNIYTVMTADTVLKIIATEAARAHDEYKYWLGAVRQDYGDGSTADANCAALASGLAQQYGFIIDPSTVTFGSPVLNTTLQDSSQITGTSCTITNYKLQLPYGLGSLVPAIIPRTVTITVAGMAVPAPAYADIYMPVHDPRSGSATGAYYTLSFPCYGGYIPTSIGISTTTGLFGGPASDFSAIPIPGMTMDSCPQANQYFQIGNQAIIGNSNLTCGPIPPVPFTGGEYLSTGLECNPGTQKGAYVPSQTSTPPVTVNYVK